MRHDVDLGIAPAAWRRVTRAQPCPICGHDTWCTVAGDASAARCKRQESDRPCPGDDGDAWLHVISDRPRTAAPTARHLAIRPRRDDLERLAADWIGNVTEARLASFAAALGVDQDALRLLGVGWTGRAWSWPMVDAERRVVGIRLRDPATGRKWAVTGGREGLFAARRTPDGVFAPLAAELDGPLLLPEGASDAAAGLTLGFDVVGRPSCTGGVRHAAVLARGRHCAVVADADGPGQRGAESLAATIIAGAASVRVVTPPAKDLREWLRAGATCDDVLALIDKAPLRTLALRFRRG